MIRFPWAIYRRERKGSMLRVCVIAGWIGVLAHVGAMAANRYPTEAARQIVKDHEEAIVWVSAVLKSHMATRGTAQAARKALPSGEKMGETGTTSGVRP